MGEMRTVSIEVDAATAGMMDDLVSEGRFADEHAVLRYSLLLLGDWLKEQEDGWNDAVETHGVDRLRAMVEEGFASGEPIEATDEFWDSIVRRGTERLKVRRAAV